ncbi:acyltransferase, partial [Klebsiella pneumoniae]|nr:acyltransferase [Klebsiella pneumoniae]
FYYMLSGRLTRIVVSINLVPIGEGLHCDFVNDKNFKSGFKRWLNGLWE